MHQVVQAHQSVCELHGTITNLRVAFLKTINVRAGERDNQRSSGIQFVEPIDRLGAAPSMQSNHRIERFLVVSFRNRYVMAEFPDQTRPAHGSISVAGLGLFVCGCNQANLHGSTIKANH